MTPAFCILAAGRGSRLGELTASVNKALLPIANEAAISHILKNVPPECEIVVAVGYDKEKVIEYCLAAHPDHTFQFVEVDPIEGPGSGPARSLAACEPHLHRPFYLCNCDTLVLDSYPDLDENWIGVSITNDPLTYATLEFDRATGLVIDLKDKDPEGYDNAYIGLVGIRDWPLFWFCMFEVLFDAKLQGRNEIQYIEVLQKMMELNAEFRSIDFAWYDIGSRDGYEETSNIFWTKEQLGMEKSINELTYKVNGRLVKLCWDAAKNLKRIQRAKLLSGLVPELVYEGRYACAYQWVEGRPLAQVNDVGVFHRFLDWCQEALWSKPYEVENWSTITHSFYCDKTMERVGQYLSNHQRSFCCSALTINGLVCQPVTSCLVRIDWQWLTTPRMVTFHGDLQFDNALLSEEGDLLLIDWRECFGDSQLYGDVYYDLAKLYNDLDLPYDLIKRQKFELRWSNLGTVEYSYQISSNLNNFRVYFERWMQRQGYDLKKVKILAALVPLNMAPLHPEPYRDLLFFHAVQRLNALLG